MLFIARGRTLFATLWVCASNEQFSNPSCNDVDVFNLCWQYFFTSVFGWPKYLRRQLIWLCCQEGGGNPAPNCRHNRWQAWGGGDNHARLRSWNIMKWKFVVIQGFSRQFVLPTERNLFIRNFISKMLRIFHNT